ncbi:MAG: 16S rRNA pseudouridine(516) synthase, partial [Erysipelotrichaceae bacterium]|nr:16S rRNA pseudouridine(516) synthase [Erysipelotrichaceae bacterium]
MIRLDKFLSYSGYGTRKETKKMIREKRVMINGICAKKDDIRIDEEHD